MSNTAIAYGIGAVEVMRHALIAMRYPVKLEEDENEAQLASTEEPVTKVGLSSSSTFHNCTVAISKAWPFQLPSRYFEDLWPKQLH